MTTRGLDSGSSSDASVRARRRTKSGAAVPPPLPAKSSEGGCALGIPCPPKPYGDSGATSVRLARSPRMVDLVLLQDPAAHRPPGRVDAALIGPAERFDKRAQIVAPVAQPARRIDALLLAAAERAQVGRDRRAAFWQLVASRLARSGRWSCCRAPASSGWPSAGPATQQCVRSRAVSMYKVSTSPSEGPSILVTLW